MRRDEATDFRHRVDNAVLVLFSLVTESVGWATAALLDDDADRAQAVIDGEHDIDKRCDEVIGLAMERLSSPNLEPEEIENLVAVLQIVPELERSGDLAEHIAQRSLDHLGSSLSPVARGLIQQMCDATVGMWKVAGSAYREGRRDASFRLGEADDHLDQLAATLVTETVGAGPNAGVAVHLALIARFYERLGDHAVNLARRIDTMAAPRRLTPLAPPDLRPGSDSEGTQHRSALRRIARRLSRFRLVPHDAVFFDLLNDAATNARDCAGDLADLVTARGDDVELIVDRVKGFERRGDELTIELLRRLDAAFVTPYDREDIHALAEEIDDVVDDMFAAASLLQLADPDQPLPELRELADVVVTMTDEMVELIGCLRATDGARFRLERIEHLERQGDAIYQRCLARLFSGEYETLEVIMLKDIVRSLEDSCNAVEDVSDVVESILVKNS